MRKVLYLAHWTEYRFLMPNVFLDCLENSREFCLVRRIKMLFQGEEDPFVLKCRKHTSISLSIPSAAEINREGLTFEEWYLISVLGLTIKYSSMYRENAHKCLMRQLWYLGKDPTDWVAFNKELFLI